MDGDLNVREQMVQQASALYGLSNAEARERLQREEAAAYVYFDIQRSLPDGYAGAWFDAGIGELVVAVTKPDQFGAIRELGGTPKLVVRTLAQLTRAQDKLSRDQAPSSIRQDLVRVSVDVERNDVELYVRRGSLLRAYAFISNLGQLDAPVRVIETDEEMRYSASVKGASGFYSPDAYGGLGGGVPCSFGVGVEGGVLTAGHCLYTTNRIWTPPSGPTLMGEGADSSWDDPGDYIDAGYGEFLPGWNSTSLVEGYTSSDFHVPGTLSGTQKFPLNTMVCRYGRTSGGPWCGEIKSFNNTVFPGIAPSKGTTQVEGTCSTAGDSGGPFFSSSGQFQGTVSVTSSPGCPITAGKSVFFTPFSKAANVMTHLVVLTDHGANAPTLSGYQCPDLPNSGAGMYRCRMNSYSSQGPTDVSWVGSSGHFSSTLGLTGYCMTSTSVTVTLDVENPYGRTDREATFPCPGGIVD